MKQIIIIGIISIFYIVSCRPSETESNVYQEDVYGNSADTVKQELESEKVDSGLIGHFIAYSSIRNKTILNPNESYHIQIEYLDPQGYCPRNLFNEGQEWYLPGDLKDGFLIMSGNNTSGSKRIGGSIELLNKRSDTLFVSLLMRKDDVNPENKFGEWSERREEIWVKQH